MTQPAPRQGVLRAVAVHVGVVVVLAVVGAVTALWLAVAASEVTQESGRAASSAGTVVWDVPLFLALAMPPVLVLAVSAAVGVLLVRRVRAPRRGVRVVAALATVAALVGAVWVALSEGTAYADLTPHTGPAVGAACAVALLGLVTVVAVSRGAARCDDVQDSETAPA